MTTQYTNLTCLCASGLSYADCCEPFHNGVKLPETAEALMRSRFTAYALRNIDYLLATWSSAKRTDTLDFSKEVAVWERLEIIKTKQGKALDTKGMVEFKAFYSQENEAYFMHEISQFIKLNGRWFYQDGVVKKVAKVKSNTNLGLNALCACGSGKKFKRCCGA